MDKNIDDGGSAFPFNENHSNGSHYCSHGGMSLRDWFAGQADVPWNAVIDTLGLKGENTPTLYRIAQYRAELKYIEADAMIAARNAKT